MLNAPDSALSPSRLVRSVVVLSFTATVCSLFTYIVFKEWVFIRICFGCRASGEKQAIEKGTRRQSAPRPELYKLRIDYSSPMATLTALMAKVMVRPMAIPAIRHG